MHFHCEVVIPPTADIEGAVALVMKPFNEASDDETERRNGFWDFYRIGGRWAGHKLMARYDSAKVEAFGQWCRDEGITVSAVQFGKQELSPASQIPKVDAKWNEMFPSAIPVPCPLFRHSNDQFGQGLSGTLPQDVCRLSDMPKDLTCSRVIFAAPSYEIETKDYTGPIEPEFMLCEDIGESVTCPHCSGEHTVLYGERVLPNGSREPSRTLGFYRCGDKSYLCAIKGRSVMEKFR